MQSGLRILFLTAAISVLIIAPACASRDGSQAGAALNQNSAGNNPSQTSGNQNQSAGHGNANSSSEQGDASPEDFDGTASITEKKKPAIAPVLLRDIRTASHEKFDRVVFEFSGDALPGYHIEYVDRPVRHCGSGEAARVAGDGLLRVRLTPANAHTEAGEPTLRYTELRPNLPNLKELKSTCDFEAEVSWVLGLSHPNRYRVLELSNPARLVLDVKH